MHVVVVGCGRVGSQLATWLDDNGHTVAVIDKDPRAFDRWLPENWGGTAILGYGYDRNHLEAAGIERADALVAVTSGDNSNILSARIARETYEVGSIAARIYDPGRASIYQRLGIPTVATVSWTVDQMLRKLFPDIVAPDWSDATGVLVLVERPLPPNWAGRKLAELDEGEQFRLVALVREGEAELPEPDTVGQDGDTLHFMVRRDALPELQKRLSGSAGGPGH